MKLFFLFFTLATLVSCDTEACSVSGPLNSDGTHQGDPYLTDGKVYPDLNCNLIADHMETRTNPENNPDGLVTYSLNSARLVTSRNKLTGLDYNKWSIPVDIYPIDGRVDLKPYTTDKVEDCVTLLFDIGLVKPVEVVVNRADLSRLALDPASTTYIIEDSNVPFGHQRMEQRIDENGNIYYVFPDNAGYHYRLKY